jgi:hypothetical protein
MAFKNLEQRYTERSQALYAAATLKFDGGKASRGANDDPLIVRKPGDGYWGFGEGRGLPVRSAAQDVKRLTLFTLSSRGVLFLAKQQLLQTGNTFQATRLINPTFVVGNAVPFIRIQRHLDTSKGLLGAATQLLGLNALASFVYGPQTYSPESLRKTSYLQEETYNKLVRDGKAKNFALRKISSPITALKNSVAALVTNPERKNYRPEIGDGKGQYFIRRLLSSGANNQPPGPETRLGKLVSKLKTAILQESPATKGTFKFGGAILKNPKYGPLLSDSRFIKYIADKGNSLDYSTERTLVPRRTVNDDVNIRLQNSGIEYRSDAGVKDDILSNYTTKISAEITKSINARIDTSRSYLKYFETSPGAGIKNQSEAINGSINARDVNRNTNKPIRYIKDPLNLPRDESFAANTKRLDVYKTLKNENDATDDIINVSFAMSSDDPVQFRAFVSNINEQSTPQYKEYQYIGRVERYISYVSVKRSVGFKLVLVAYSEDELQTVWKKINYLTALTYPYNVYKGILQPNIVKLSLGNIYTDQPGYVTSIRSDFGGNISSWDIDKQVPHGATVDIQFDIIEKRGVTTAGTELYGILQQPV